MMMKLILYALLYYNSIAITTPSIAGVTYMDNFDFEERYKDIHECDPFYWHPLHLPEVCADMFENLIRSRLAKNGPIRLMRKKQPDDYYNLEQMDMGNPYPWYQDYMPMPYTQHQEPAMYDIGKVHKTPYEKMLDLLKEDIKKEPSIPKLGVLPNLGPVAIYNQEISKKSETMIKKLATAYAKIGQKAYANYIGYNESPDPQMYVWDSEKNRTDENKEKRKKKKNKVSRTKTKQGGVITIVETRNPRNRRSILHLFGSQIKAK